MNSPVLALPGRVLYAVRHSFPFASNGYAVRTHGVARALVQSGCQVLVCTAPGLPWNQPGQDGRHWPNHHQIDGVIKQHLFCKFSYPSVGIIAPS